MTLDATDPPAAAATGEPLAGIDDRPPRVLVVDDDEANRESLARRLQRRGHEVEIAVDGLTALAAVETAAVPFDLVILDVMMPGLSGLEVLTRLRERHTAAALPVIMATARDTSEDVVEAFKLGASDYVTKPLDFQVVMARVQTQLSLRRSVARVLALEKYLSERNVELESANQRLRAAAERTNREMALAARIQATYLPRESAPQVADGRVRCAWRYEPSEHLAGDALNVFSLDDEHVGLYVLDVSGHGVAASLTAVTAARMLSGPGDPDSILCDRSNGRGCEPRPPRVVLEQLNERFAFNADTGQFVTCFYAVLNTTTRVLRYASAGHPGPLWSNADRPARTFESTGLPVGIGDGYEEREVTLAAGDRVFAYSDGIIESRSPGGEFFQIARLADLVDATRSMPLADAVERIEQELAAFRGGKPAGDDVSLLSIECT